MRTPRHSVSRCHRSGLTGFGLPLAIAMIIASLVATACSTIETPVATDAASETDAASQTESATETEGPTETQSAAETDATPEPTPVIDTQTTEAGDPEASDTETADSTSGEDPEPDTSGDNRQSAAADVISFETSSCSFDQLVPLPIEPTCYSLVVPEDWDAPDPTDVVTITAAVFKSTGAAPFQDPIMYLEGGPGGHSLEGVAFNFGGLVEPHLETRDFIVFDQRGAGLSEPSLACPEATEVGLANSAVADAVDVEEQAALAALMACRDRLLADGVDLTEYHSINSSHDVEALRVGLGYDQLNLLGISYGTRLAQTVVRLYPDSIRSVIYDSVVPNEAELFSALSANAERSMKHMFSSCASDPECAAAHPDLETRFFALVDQLEAEPVALDALNPLTAESTAVVVTGVDLLNLTFSALYSRVAFGAIPQLVEDAEAGEYPVIEAFASQGLIQGEFLSYGMLLSVECHEELPFDERAALDVYTPEQLYEPVGKYLSGKSLFDACDIWPAGAAPAIEDELLVSDIPGLLLAGQYDPITPPSGLADIAAGLTTSWSYVFPHEGHAVAPSPCGAEVITSFLESPTTEPDTSCVADTPPPAFTPGDNSEVDLVPFESSVLGSTVVGVRPASWADQGFGIFARTETVVDPTLLLVQATFGTPASLLQGLLGASFGDLLGEEVTFDPAAEITAGGSTWQTLKAELDGQTLLLAINDEVLVGIAARPDELDRLTELVLVPALEAVETS